MPEPRRDLVIEALTAPADRFSAWRAEEWSLFMRQARTAGLLGRAATRLKSLLATGDSHPWPAALDTHIRTAERVMSAQRHEVERELRCIARALADLGAPVIVLKGAAYLAAGLPPGQSRVFSDVDILVPRTALSDAESRLMLHGWMGTHDNAYDQRYYREWMHELPPMQHVQRGTTVDVHHNILPLTARLKPRADLLFDAAVALPDRWGLRVLCDTDMVLHSMTHLFMNDDMSHALRDLSDLDLLLRHFGSDPSFWARLVERAHQLDLVRPLHYGVRHAIRVLGTPVPRPMASSIEDLGPPTWLRPLMDATWRRVLRSPFRARAPIGTGAALLSLYVRGHWLRMPPLLLARHLFVKTFRLHEREDKSSVTVPVQG